MPGRWQLTTDNPFLAPENPHPTQPPFTPPHALQIQFCTLAYTLLFDPCSRAFFPVPNGFEGPQRLERK
jgi:hypothetical protein